MHFRNLTTGLLAVLAMVWVMATAPQSWAGTGAVIPLPAGDRAALDSDLGAGVVGEPVPAWTLQPTMATPHAGAWSYKVVTGADAGKKEQHVIGPMAKDASGATWRYSVDTVKGTVRVDFLRQDEDMSLSTTSEQDLSQGVLTRFSPAEPKVLVGLNAGDQRSMKIKVSVYNLTDESDLQHTGSLKVIDQYIGAYKVTVPAGTFEAALLKSSYNGKVGPATVKDTEYTLVAQDGALLASADKRDISAMFFYNDNSKEGLVLAEKR